MKCGVFAPSAFVDPDGLSQAAEHVRQFGFACHIHDQTHKRYHQSAGTPQEKATALHDLLQNPAIEFLWTACGGNRAALMMDTINYDILRKHADKPLVGFSDVTYLLNAFYKITGKPQIHGPGLWASIKPHISDDNIKQLAALLKAIRHKTAYHLVFEDITTLKSVDVPPLSGTIIGGNLSLFQALIGTPYLPQDKDIILFFEDIGDQLSRYDRMLWHIRNSGIFERCRAVLIGDLSCGEDKGARAFGFSKQDILQDVFNGYDFPVFMRCPFGHRGEFSSLPVGANVELTATDTKLSLAFSF